MNHLINNIKKIRSITSASIVDCKSALLQSDGNLEHAIKILKEKGILKASSKLDRKAEKGLIVSSNCNNIFIMVEIKCETDFAANSSEIKALGDKFVDKICHTKDIKFGKYNSLNDFHWDVDDKTYIDNLVKETISIIKEKIVIEKFIILNNNFIGSYLHHNKLMGAVVNLNITENDKITTELIDDIEMLCKDLAMHVLALNPQFISKNTIDKNFIESQKEILCKQKEDFLKSKPVKLAEKIIDSSLNKTLSDICLVDQKFIKTPKITVADEIAKYASSWNIKISIENFYILKI